MPWRRCRGRRLWRERIAPPYQFQEEFYDVDLLPDDVPDLQLWLRPEALAALVDGAAVAEWDDASATGRDTEQSNALLRPVYHTAVRNGLAAVLFNGVDQVLRFSTEGVLATWTVIAAYQPLAMTNAYNYVLAFFDGEGCYAGGTDVHYGPGIGAAIGVDVPPTEAQITATAPSDWNVTSWTSSGMYLDGVSLVTTRYGAAPRQVFDSVGNCSSVSNHGLHGYVGEMVYYPRLLDGGERAGVEAYLRHRWGTP